MQVIGCLQLRRDFRMDTLDRSRVQLGNRAELGWQATSQAHRVRATVLCFLVVEECVRSRTDDPVRQHRWLRGIATVDTDLTRFDALEQGAYTFDIEGFV